MRKEQELGRTMATLGELKVVTVVNTVVGLILHRKMTLYGHARWGNESWCWPGAHLSLMVIRLAVCLILFTRLQETVEHKAGDVAHCFFHHFITHFFYGNYVGKMFFKLEFVSLMHAYVVYLELLTLKLYKKHFQFCISPLAGQ